jgi:hypothetical protein
MRVRTWLSSSKRCACSLICTFSARSWSFSSSRTAQRFLAAFLSCVRCLHSFRFFGRHSLHVIKPAGLEHEPCTVQSECHQWSSPLSNAASGFFVEHEVQRRVGFSAMDTMGGPTSSAWGGSCFATNCSPSTIRTASASSCCLRRPPLSWKAPKAEQL